MKIDAITSSRDFKRMIDEVYPEKYHPEKRKAKENLENLILVLKEIK